MVKQTDDPEFNLEDELTLLEQIWVERLSPCGKNSYNLNLRIRE
jgi:hypothetical protein